MAERMVTLGKRGDGPARRLAYAYVRELPALKKLFDTLGPRYKLREGGYTRVIRSRYRRGDKALMAYIEFVDRPGELRPARPPRSVRLHMESKAKAQQGDGQVQIPPIESAP
jgi:large subunit ribosomal protein L17